jgi:DtxR family Mn-dependent transcriptional regulator
MERAINDASYWREFENNSLTHSMAHYLMAVDSLRDNYGYARVTDVAEMLEVSRGAASMSISHLKKRGWVSADRNGMLLLTKDGEGIARLVEQNFNVLSTFFQQVLDVEKEVALGDACKMEHLMSLETGRRLVLLMRYILSDDKRADDVRKMMTNISEGCEDVSACPICGETGTCMARSSFEKKQQEEGEKES